MDFLDDFDDFDTPTDMCYDDAKTSTGRSTSSEDTTAKKTKQPSSRRKPRRRKRMLTGVSKQRRAANERERKRLQIINNAFIGLKDLLPLLPGEENISKIDVVKLASRTILLLKEILDDCDRKVENEEERSSCASSSCSGSIDSIEEDSSSVLSNFSQENQDFSFLLFPSDDIKFNAFGDSVDSGLGIPSPCISDSSSYTTSSKESSEFPFMEDDPIHDDDVFCKGPTMCLW
eukprot:gene3276-3757_t